MQNNEINERLNMNSIIDKAYEQVRLVDPVNKRVIKYYDNSVRELHTQCFDFWEKSKLCDNCISMRALNEDKTFVKVEYTNDRLFMVTAVPLELSDRRVVIEMLKDVTDSIVFGADGKNDGLKTEIHAMIDSLNTIAMRDSLTGLYNRRYINEKLPVDIVNTAFAEQDLSLILADIDHFKNVNDTYGHLMGDCVLKSFAESISRSVSKDGGWIARFGGEEFLICLPGANLEKAMGIAENMRKTAEQMEVLSGEKVIKITSSFGIYSGKLNQNELMENIIKKADEKLYAAKENGRNRVEY